LATSPLREQYLTIKNDHVDCLLFFRLGDFYETFDEDAETVARELDIVLTGRSFSKGTRVPMAGVPHHSLENYLPILLDKGYHVAICDQVGSFNAEKGLVERAVTQILTPGTIHEPAMLAEEVSNFLLAIIPKTPAGKEDWVEAGIAHCDFSTGEFATTQLSGEAVGIQVLEELARLKPREVLLPQRWKDSKVTFPRSIHCNFIPDWVCGWESASRALLSHFNVESLQGFGLESKPLAVAASSAILYYLRQTQKGVPASLSHLQTYDTSAFMTLDLATRRNLEITESFRDRKIEGSLWGVLKATETAMGSRKLLAWIKQPLLDIDRIQQRLDAVETLTIQDAKREIIRDIFRIVIDLERMAQRIVLQRANPRELLSLKESLSRIPEIKRELSAEPAFRSITNRLTACEETVELIAAAIDEDAPTNMNRYGSIREGYSSELDGILQETAQARQWIADLEPRERKRTGIQNLKVGFNKVFGYYLEVSKSNLAHVPDDYIRKQTLVNAERYVTPELKEYETVVLNAEEELLACEKHLFDEILQQLAPSCDAIKANANAIADLDAVLSLATVAVREAYSRPQLTQENILRIKKGRHPVVEQSLPTGQRYIPNDTAMDEGSRIHIITGPNMSGKSTYIRQVAIINLMAQIGSFVPADEAMVGITDRIFARIGAQDEIHAGQSTFMVEMIETARLLSGSSERSLLIIDEVGRGTSTYDGLAIARAVIEYIHDEERLNCRTLFATHFHELTELPQTLPRAKNYNIAVMEEGERVIFTHQLSPGGANRSYGVHVAQLAGVPNQVIQRAQRLLEQMENPSRRIQELSDRESRSADRVAWGTHAGSGETDQDLTDASSTEKTASAPGPSGLDLSQLSFFADTED